MFSIEVTPEADDDLSQWRVYDQRRIVAAIELQLSHEPNRETRQCKRLRPNDVAEWEPRTGDFRVFYDVFADDQRVRVVAIGEKRGGSERQADGIAR